MWHTMALTALLSSEVCWGFHLLSNCFLSTYPGIKAGDNKVNWTDDCSFLLDCKGFRCVFETSVMRDHGSDCDSVTSSRVGLEQATHPVS